MKKSIKTVYKMMLSENIMTKTIEKDHDVFEEAIDFVKTYIVPDCEGRACIFSTDMFINRASRKVQLITNQVVEQALEWLKEEQNMYKNDQISYNDPDGA